MSSACQGVRSRILVLCPFPWPGQYVAEDTPVSVAVAVALLLLLIALMAMWHLLGRHARVAELRVLTRDGGCEVVIL